MIPGPTVGLLSAGAMGSAVARRLTLHGCTVLTSLIGRSQASKDRARAAGMTDVGIDEIARRARFVLSIMPPSEALAFATLFSKTMHHIPPASTSTSTSDPTPPTGDRPPSTPLIFADCNAVSPTTVSQIASLFPDPINVTFIDACIIGGPPTGPGEGQGNLWGLGVSESSSSVESGSATTTTTPSYDPTFYASGLSDAVLAFRDVLGQRGLKISALDAGVGDASALKMGYAGINKGLTGLTAAMILATHASSPATSAALMRELSLSQPALLSRTARAVPDMLPKAYRFVHEMEEIGSFVEKGVDSGTADIWRGLARLFERVSKSVESSGEVGEHGRGGDAGDVDVLEEWVRSAKERLSGGGSGGSK